MILLITANPSWEVYYVARLVETKRPPLSSEKVTALRSEDLQSLVSYLHALILPWPHAPFMPATDRLLGSVLRYFVFDLKDLVRVDLLTYWAFTVRCSY